MHTTLMERRRKMLQYKSEGLSLADIVKHLATEYNVSLRSLYYDWEKRKQWMATVLEISDPETFFLDLVSRHHDIYRMTILEYLRGDNSNARIGALRLLRDINNDFQEMIVTQDLHDRIRQLEAGSS